MKPILEVRGLWKQYQRGAQKEKYLSIRDSLFKGFKRGGKKETFWALQDINFDVYPGDSLAIIGKNGAGKSTLLKILSKITPPTKGEIILRGRLASLLEVGTGFHPELTGRENIYLNGSILGLGRAEINRQFDAIVDFSGVEVFLDTPLKHYSSGMQLRLAFAVAAHLEPEILVIDEVLAVGDSSFQQKCINKMTEVSRSGRTVLFVSHNVAAIKTLCTKAVLLDDGCFCLEGTTDIVLDKYLSNEVVKRNEIDLLLLPRHGKPTMKLLFKKIKFADLNFRFGEPIEFELWIEGKHATDLEIAITISDIYRTVIYHVSNQWIASPLEFTGDEYYKLSISNNLKPGKYILTLFMSSGVEITDWIKDACELTVLNGNPYNYPRTEDIQGHVFPEFNYSIFK